MQVVLRPQQAVRDPALVDYRAYAGQVAEGVVRVGDEVVVLPSGRRTSVVGIDTADGEPDGGVRAALGRGAAGRRPRRRAR
ncbi:hypothetical protein GCM10025868_26950 [Angustibacter aerolatus]|uniref:Primosomal protein N' 3' DNA-binding domain-containing protein n=1 Tax=Angustibacter aerolatus TaxID=1162965 RepID=A0ABQ6JKY1_9ACTN|nr:hypothetical protein GCM10025868_26950 [Angustibacter aerolatus]